MWVAVTITGCPLRRSARLLEDKRVVFVCGRYPDCVLLGKTSADRRFEITVFVCSWDHE